MKLSAAQLAMLERVDSGLVCGKNDIRGNKNETRSFVAPSFRPLHRINSIHMWCL